MVRNKKKRKYFQLTKVAIVSRVNFIMNIINFFAIVTIKLDTPKTLFSQIFTLEKKQSHNKHNFQN
jgi:hypothetical protein